jgi:hypothetical protein
MTKNNIVKLLHAISIKAKMIHGNIHYITRHLDDLTVYYAQCTRTKRPFTSSKMMS